MSSNDEKPGVLLPPYFPFLFMVLNAAALLVPRSRFRNLLLGSVPLVYTVYLLLTSRKASAFAGFADQNAQYSWLTTSIFMWLDFLAVSNPEAEFVRDGEKLPLNRRTPTFWDRVKWALSLTTTSRGIGWNWQVNNVPPRAPKGYPKWPFIKARALSMLPAAVVFIAVNLYGSTLPEASLPKPRSLYDEPFYLQAAYAWLIGLRAWSGMKSAYDVASIIGIAIGLYEPSEWPALFGAFSETYTVRGFWGKAWHQLMRRVASTFGRLITKDIFGFGKGTFASKYTQLYVGFLVTGLIHALAGYAIGGTDLNSWEFFLGQAVIITIEDHVVDIAKARGVKESAFWHTVGHFWMFAWFSYSLRSYAGGLISLGAFCP